MPFPTNSPQGENLLRRVNDRFQGNPVWMQLLLACARVIENRVTQPRGQLSHVRSPYKYHRGDWITLPSSDGMGQRAIVNSVRKGGGDAGGDMVFAQLVGENTGVEFSTPDNFKEKEVQVAGCKLHGFNYFADSLSKSDYARVHEWIERYWPESGTVNFARFMGFIKNMKLEVHQLWSEEVAGFSLPDDFYSSHNSAADPRDYYPYLERYPQSATVYEGGAAYPTSHVELSYDPVIDPIVDTRDLFYLFYYMAPINLVLHRIVADVETLIPNRYGVPAPFVRMDEMAYLQLDENLNVTYQDNDYPVALIDSVDLIDNSTHAIDGASALLI